MNHVAPNRRQIEARLRERYTEIWADVRRDLHDHEQHWYERLMRIAGRPATATERRDEWHGAAIDREVEELRAVHAALARLERGEYGLCQACGDEISAARLEQAPHAALCTVCDARAEQPGASARRSDAHTAVQKRNV